MTQAQPPIIDGLPCLADLSRPWTWTLTEIGTADAGQGEGLQKLYLLRIFTSNAFVEVAAPKSYLKGMIDRMAMVISGLEIARDLPPNGQRP